MKTVNPTEVLSYVLSDDGTYYICDGIGTATNTNIAIASEIDGKPVTRIGNSAFFGCVSLRLIEIPTSVTSIEEGAFGECLQLSHVYYTGTEAQWNTIIVGDGNDYLTSATIHFNYVPQVLKAGTYRFNDVLTEIGNYDDQHINYTITSNFPEYGELTVVGTVIDQSNEPGVNIAFTVTNETLGITNYRTYLYSDGWKTDIYGEGIKTITIPEDTNVSEDFYAWFMANTNVGSTFISYDGRIIANHLVGQTVAIQCKGAIMKDNIVVSVAEESVPNLQEKHVTENGRVVADEGYDGLSKVEVAVPERDIYYRCYFVTFPKTEYKVGQWLSTANGVVCIERNGEAWRHYNLRNSDVYGFVLDAETESVVTDAPGTYNLDVIFDYDGTTYKTTYQITVVEDTPAVPELKLQDKEFTENDTYTADDGFDGLGTVTVKVQPNLQEKSVTENGDVTPDEGYYGLSKVKVNVASGGGENKFKQLLNGTLTEVTEEDLQGAAEIKSYQFYFQKNLASVTLTSTITTVQQYAFNGCFKLIDLILNEGLSGIGNYSFATCSTLASVTLPSTLSSIGSNAFSSCAKLNSVVVKSFPPPTIQSNTFFALPASCVWYVPVNTADVFKNTTNWSAKASKIVGDERAGIRELQPENGDYLFKDAVLSGEGEDYTLDAPSPGETYTLYLNGIEVATAVAVADEFETPYLTFRTGVIYYSGGAWYDGDGVTKYSVLHKPVELDPNAHWLFQKQFITSDSHYDLPFPDPEADVSYTLFIGANEICTATAGDYNLIFETDELRLVCDFDIGYWAFDNSKPIESGSVSIRING